MRKKKDRIWRKDAGHGQEGETKERGFTQEEHFYRCLTEVEDALILEAAEPFSEEDVQRIKSGMRAEGFGSETDFEPRKPDGFQKKPANRSVFSFTRWAAFAAVILAALGAGVLIRVGRLGKYAGNDTGSALGESGSDPGNTFLSYAGPAFPLTLAEADEEITAARSLTLDFAPWEKQWRSNEEEVSERGNLTDAEKEELLLQYQEWYPEGGYYRTSTNILVTDACRLTNHAGVDKRVTAVYPFVSTLQDLPARLPELLIDKKADAGSILLFPGGYAGGFAGVQREDGVSEGAWNLEQPACWEDYAALLADGSYQEHAFSEKTGISDIPVTVYQFSDPWGPEISEEMPNPTIRVEFEMDYEKTQLLTYGFHQESRDAERNRMAQGFSVSQSGAYDDGSPFYLIVIGEDIRDMQMQGYATGGWDTEEKVEAGVTVERYETDLDTALRPVTARLWKNVTQTDLVSFYGGALGELLDYEKYHELYADYLLHYGILSPDGIDRYQNGMLEGLDVLYVERVCYLTVPVTIRAGETVEISAALRKAASFDYACAETQNRGIYGYDAVTRIGSNLTFSAQTATLADRGQIEIVRQNFGFDPENGVYSVELNPAQEHYYLEVRRK